MANLSLDGSMESKRETNDIFRESFLQLNYRSIVGKLTQVRQNERIIQLERLRISTRNHEKARENEKERERESEWERMRETESEWERPREN